MKPMAWMMILLQSSGALAMTLLRSPMMKWSTGTATGAGVATGVDWASNMTGSI